MFNLKLHHDGESDAADNGKTLSKAMITGIASSLGLPPNLLPLARSGFSCLLSTNAAASPDSLVPGTARPFAISPKSPVVKRAEIEWAVFGAVLFALIYGDRVDNIRLDESKKLHADVRTDFSFRAKFLKLSRGATDERALDRAISELELICFTKNLRQGSASKKAQYSVLNRKYAEDVRKWVSRVRELAISSTIDSSMSSSVEERDEKRRMIGGSMIRPSVMFLTEKRRREYELWRVAATRKIRRKLESKSKAERVMSTRSSIQV